MDIESWKKKSQEEILAAIREKSALIVATQKLADTKGLSVDAAIGLQKLRNERKALQSLLRIELIGS